MRVAGAERSGHIRVMPVVAAVGRSFFVEVVMVLFNVFTLCFTL